MGSNQLTREKLEFDTRAVPDPLTQDAQKQSKTTVDNSVFSMAEDRPTGN